MPRKTPKPPQHGGHRANAGRPAGDADKSVVATFRCSPEVRDKFRELGGADWVTPKIIKAR